MTAVRALTVHSAFFDLGTLVLTEHVCGPCRRCGFRFYLSVGTAEHYRTGDPDATDAQIAAELDLCLSCVTGVLWPAERPPLFEVERLRAPLRFEAQIIQTTKQGLIDFLALDGERWAGRLSAEVLAFSAPDPLESIPRMATAAELEMRRARAVALLGEPQPLRCGGEWDEYGRAVCEGPDVRCVTFTTSLDPDVEQRANWCSDCRADAVQLLGHTILSVATPA